MVEDESAVRGLCELVLMKHSFETLLATNGVEGLAKFTDQASEIRLVITDVAMPGMSGLEMVRKILELRSGVKVLIMSGDQDSDRIPEDLAGSCSMLHKPFTLNELVDAVNRCFLSAASGSS